MKRATVTLLWAIALLAIGSSTAFAQNRLAGRFGEAVVGNQRVIVHVTVAVPPGQSENDVTENALRGQGARPLQPAEFKTSGLVWDQFFNDTLADDQVLQNYNSAGEPVAASPSLTNSENTWSGVTTSTFQFASGATTRCPSLVKECPGAQTFDGFNDVGWAAISGCCTLAVTWYGTSIDEADMALNTRFQWSTNGGSGYDIETVMLHENGHVLGLDHSTASGSVMQATYATVRRSLGEDDERGVTYLYPEPSDVGSISGTVTSSSSGSPIAGATISIPNFPNSATTDASGVYSFDGVPDIGSYSITASAQGYTSATQDNVIVPTSGLDFILQGQSGGGGGCVPKGKGYNCK